MTHNPTVKQMVSSGLENAFLMNHWKLKFNQSEETIRALGCAYAEEVESRLSEYTYEPIMLTEEERVLGELGLSKEEGRALLEAIDNLIYQPRKKIKPYRGIHRFKNRADGRRLNTINPFMKIFPYIMKTRNDAHNLATLDVDVDDIEEYIKEKRKEGMSITYLHVFMTIFIRIFALRPELNRYIMGNRHYARNEISVSFSVMKSLRDGGEETTLKFHFNGHESIYDVYHTVETAIAESMAEPDNTAVDKVLDVCLAWPSPFLSFVSGCIKLSDRLNMLHHYLLHMSPFHASMFVSYLKSIKLPSIYHHIYNFGSTSLFFAIGKEEKKAVVRDGKIEIRKICQIGTSMDERICEGLYLAYTFRMMKQLFRELDRLDVRLKTVLEDVD